MKNYIFPGILVILTILYVSLSSTIDFTPIQTHMFQDLETTSLSKKNRAQLYATYIFGYLLSILLVVYEIMFLSQEYVDNIILRSIQFIIILILLILSIVSTIYSSDSKLVKTSQILQPFTVSLWIILSSCFKKSILPKILKSFNKSK
jgi:hypothetical protein